MGDMCRAAVEASLPLEDWRLGEIQAGQRFKITPSLLSKLSLGNGLQSKAAVLFCAPNRQSFPGSWQNPRTWEVLLCMASYSRTKQIDCWLRALEYS